MKVKYLKRRLQDFDDNAEIYIKLSGNSYAHVERIEKFDDGNLLFR